MINVKKICLTASAAMAMTLGMFVTSCQNLENPKEGDIATIKAGDTSFEMVYIAPGEFRMGATAEQQGTDPNEQPSHKVILTKGYWIGQLEVSQAQWVAIMGSNPSEYKGEPGKEDLELPVNGVSWADCQAFVKKLSEVSGMTFRLPTEAEWEYAARGGHKADGLMYSGSIYVENVACCQRNSGGVPSKVGAYMPNKLELRDMSGNVAELVADNYALYKDSVYTDPLIVTADTLPHVARGGGFNTPQAGCRTSSRASILSESKLVNVGLRVVMEGVK